MKKIIIIFIGICILIFAGCKGGGSEKNGQSIKDNNKMGTIIGDTISNEKKDSLNEMEDEKKYISTYTGENITKLQYENIPFLAIIENMKAARPQSGLSSADIVFETLAEGGIPRFMALFQSNTANKIGPIRSDRVYFNEISESFNLPFAHCGGSEAALQGIINRNLMSLNEMSNGIYYWRDRSRKMPHNLYTSSAKITKLINKKGYVMKPNFNIDFNNDYWENVKAKVSRITIKFSGYYTTAYNYSNGIYYKMMNDVAVPDKNNGEKLSAKNIIIQIAKIAPIKGDEKKRVEVKLTGSGKGYIFSNGSYKKIKWYKANEYSQIKLMDENNEEIKLSKGNTWWEIVDDGSDITIK